MFETADAREEIEDDDVEGEEDYKGNAGNADEKYHPCKYGRPSNPFKHTTLPNLR